MGHVVYTLIFLYLPGFFFAARGGQSPGWSTPGSARAPIEEIAKQLRPSLEAHQASSRMAIGQHCP